MTGPARFGAARRPSTDSFDPREHDGRLLAISTDKLLRDVQTRRYGPRPAVRADIVVIDTTPPRLLRQVLVFPTRLIRQLIEISQGGLIALGRLEKGEDTGSGVPPWQLADPSPDEIALADRTVGDRLRPSTPLPNLLRHDGPGEDVPDPDEPPDEWGRG